MLTDIGRFFRSMIGASLPAAAIGLLITLAAKAPGVPTNMGLLKGSMFGSFVLLTLFIYVRLDIVDKAAAYKAAVAAAEKATRDAAEKAAMTRAAEVARIAREAAAAAEAVRQDRIALSLMPVGQQVRTVKQRETARLIAEQLATDTAYCNARIQGGWQPKFDDEVAAMKASIDNGTCRAMTWNEFTHFVWGYFTALQARVHTTVHATILEPCMTLVDGKKVYNKAPDIEAHNNGAMPLEHLISKLELGRKHCQTLVTSWAVNPSHANAGFAKQSLDVVTTAIDELKGKLDSMVAANPLLEATEIFTPGQQTFLPPSKEGKGFVYLLKDPVHTGVLKIGMTAYNPRLRAEKFGMDLAAYAETDDRVGSERKMHEIFNPVRLGTYELFRVHLSEAATALAKVCGNTVIFVAD